MPLVGSSPTASAFDRAHRPTGRRQLRRLAVLTLDSAVQLPVSPLNTIHGPVVQRHDFGLHPDNEGSIPSGTVLDAQVRQLAERHGSGHRDRKRSTSCADAGSTPALGTDRLDRQRQTTLA